jgi:subtilase family serine protease
VWSDGSFANGDFGGGGTGFSYGSGGDPSEPFTSYTRPAHQPTILNGVADFNNGIRVCPDICSLADPFTGLLIIFPNSAGTLIKKIVSGGTSLASPLMCGLFSHLSQRRINEGLPSFTTRINNTSNNLQKLLYDNFKQNGTFTQSSPLFYDIRSGSTVLPTITELGPNNNGRTFSAGPGYDIATGLGFANMQNIQTAIFRTSQQIDTPPIDSGSGINNGTNTGGGGTFQVTIAQPVGRPNAERNLVRIDIN